MMFIRFHHTNAIDEALRITFDMQRAGDEDGASIWAHVCERITLLQAFGPTGGAQER